MKREDLAKQIDKALGPKPTPGADHTVIGMNWFNRETGEQGKWKTERVYYEDYSEYERLPDVARCATTKAEYEAYWAKRRKA